MFLAVTTAQMNLPVGWKIIGVAAVVFLWDPVLVSLAGGTIGHHLRGMRVQHREDGANLGAFRACLRFAVKTLLGWLSLVLVLTTKKHQAIHDYISGSVVTIKDPYNAPGHAFSGERILPEANFIIPSKLRRVTMIVFYSVLLFLANNLISALFISDACVFHGTCSSRENLISGIFDLAWLVSMFVVVYLGWQGRLWGAMRKERHNDLDGPNPS